LLLSIFLFRSSIINTKSMNYRFRYRLINELVSGMDSAKSLYPCKMSGNIIIPVTSMMTAKSQALN
jgi:hypothetical protein